MPNKQTFGPLSRLKSVSQRKLWLESSPNGTDLSDFRGFRGSGILPRLLYQSRLEGAPTRRHAFK